jgi:hypothetical protein
MLPQQTCTNPACPMFKHTVNHETVDLSKYGCSQHPDWKAPTT